MSEFVINIANDFTQYPTGRYKKHGRGSGEEFRDDVLIPALNSHERVVVELSGTVGYASSFLEESFGGLIRNGLSEGLIKKKLIIRASDNSYESYEILANEFIEDAATRESAKQSMQDEAI